MNILLDLRVVDRIIEREHLGPPKTVELMPARVYQRPYLHA